MELDNIHKKLKEIIGDQKVSFSILEEEIDVELQMEFFDFIKKEKPNFREFNELLNVIDTLFDNEANDDEKKKIIAELSQSAEVKAYRTIEKYISNNTGSIIEWAKLAIQQCRMNLESELLDEKQVFISTGLGGKNNSLRYFVVLYKKDKSEYDKTQKKIVRNEFEYCFKNNDCEIEKLKFNDDYVSMIVLMPLKIDLNDVFDCALLEINKMGNFLSENYIITNVKKLTKREIYKAIMKKKNSDNN